MCAFIFTVQFTKETEWSWHKNDKIIILLQFLWLT